MNITPATKPFTVSGMAGITGAATPGTSFADVFGNAVNEVESITAERQIGGHGPAGRRTRAMSIPWRWLPRERSFRWNYFSR